MATYKMLKLKNYIYHLILGTFLVLFSLSIIQSIVSEMLSEYKVSSRIAYIAGIAACLAILGFAVFTIYRSFRFDKLLLKNLTRDQKSLLFDELENHIQMIVKGQVIMTTHYLIVPIGRFGPYKLLDKKDIIACFKTERHQETKAINGRLRIFTSDFKSTVVTIGGKGSAQVEQEMLNRMIKSMPWIIHEKYEDFLLKSKTKGMRKILVEEVEDDRAEYIQTDPALYAPDDTLSLSRTSIPIIGQTDGGSAAASKPDEETIEVKASSLKKEAPVTAALTEKFASAGSMINHFLQKTKKAEGDRASTIGKMFEEIENGHEETVPKHPKTEEKTEILADTAAKHQVEKNGTEKQQHAHQQTDQKNAPKKDDVTDKKDAVTDETVILTPDQRTAILSFEHLIMSSSKNRSSAQYKKE